MFIMTIFFLRKQNWLY